MCKISFETILTRLETSFPEYKQYYELDNSYGVKKGYVVVITKYGECLVKYKKLLKKSIPSVRSAIDKNLFTTNQIKEKFGDRFECSKLEYKSAKSKILLFDNKLKSFVSTTIDTLLRAIVVDKKTFISVDLQTFINKVNSKNPEIFKEFELISEYKSSTSKILLKNKYGIVKVNPRKLLEGKTPTIQSAVDKNEYFSNIAREIHGNQYDYSLVNYTTNKAPVIVTCKLHGSFSIIAATHIFGKCGCKTCSNLKKSNNFDKDDSMKLAWVKSYNNHKNKLNLNPTLYVLKCTDDTKNETFYKIGITFNGVKKRFASPSSLPYTYEVLKTVEGTAEYISKLEEILHKYFKQYKYIPKKKFCGMYECFSQIDLSLI